MLLRRTRHATPIVILLVALGCAVLRSQEQPQPAPVEQRNAQPQPSGGQNSNAQTSEPPTVYNILETTNDSDRAQQNQSNWDKFLDNAVTDPIVGLTAALLLLTLVQLGAYITEITDTRRVERAYLTVSTIRLVNFAIGHKPDISLSFKNSGHMPAGILEWAAGMTISSIPETVGTLNRHGGVVTPGERLFLHVNIETNGGVINTTLWNDLHEGRKQLSLYGVIRYTTGFKNGSGETRFGFMFEPSLVHVPIEERLVPVPEHQHNYAK